MRLKYAAPSLTMHLRFLAEGTVRQAVGIHDCKRISVPTLNCVCTSTGHRTTRRLTS